MPLWWFLSWSVTTLIPCFCFFLFFPFIFYFFACKRIFLALHMCVSERCVSKLTRAFQRLIVWLVFTKATAGPVPRLRTTKEQEQGRLLNPHLLQHQQNLTPNSHDSFPFAAHSHAMATSRLGSRGETKPYVKLRFPQHKQTHGPHRIKQKDHDSCTRLAVSRSGRAGRVNRQWQQWKAREGVKGTHGYSHRCRGWRLIGDLPAAAFDSSVPVQVERGAGGGEWRDGR